MLFTSLEFLLFLPVAVLLFWWLPARLRLPWLLLASLGFYASFAIENLAYLAAVAVIALTAGRYLAKPDAARRRLALWAGVLAVLGLMGALKYYAPLAESVAWLPQTGLRAPAGFSFYAFTAIALLIDRYRTPAEVSASIRQDMLYLAWFPKLLAGPIERIAPFTAELARRAPMKPVHFAMGGQLFLWGLVKKVVVADNLAPFVDRVYAIPEYAVPLELIIATYFFAFQIYCDFSGYTDMARGASQLFGIRLSENFRRSYFAHSISEFWSRRWHISLAGWFRDYLYYPFISDSRTAVRMYLGLMIVFLVSGIWHAGLGYGIGWAVSGMGGAERDLPVYRTHAEPGPPRLARTAARAGRKSRLSRFRDAAGVSSGAGQLDLLPRGRSGRWHRRHHPHLGCPARPSRAGHPLPVHRRARFSGRAHHGLAGDRVRDGAEAAEKAAVPRPAPAALDRHLRRAFRPAPAGSLAKRNLRLHAVLKGRTMDIADRPVHPFPKRPIAAFAALFIALYAVAVGIAEATLDRAAPQSAFQKLLTMRGKQVDWAVLGASHALPLVYGDVSARLQRDAVTTIEFPGHVQTDREQNPSSAAYAQDLARQESEPNCKCLLPSSVFQLD